MHFEFYDLDICGKSYAISKFSGLEADVFPEISDLGSRNSRKFRDFPKRDLGSDFFRDPRIPRSEISETKNFREIQDLSKFETKFGLKLPFFGLKCHYFTKISNSRKSQNSRNSRI